MRNALLFALVFFARIVSSQSIQLDDYVIADYKVYFKKSDKSPHFWNEIPPWVLQGRDYQYFLTTYYSTMWSSPLSIAQPKDNFLFVGSHHGSAARWIISSSHWWGHFYDPEFMAGPGYEYRLEWEKHYWRRNYNGIFSAHIIQNTHSKQNILFAISHGENKNEKVGKYLYQNTVRSDFLIDGEKPDTYSGGKVYKECWDAYFGFLNGNWINQSDNYNLIGAYLHDIGPIAWPSAGYLRRNGAQASKGLRHPSSIVYGNHLYIYVIDESMDGTGGVKLIRAHINDVLNPSSFETWSSKGWIASLPYGFTKDHIADYFKVRGPDNKPVFSPEQNTIRFSVANIKGTNNFIGVEEYVVGGEDNTIKVALRFSDDLINWSERKNIYQNKNWSSSNFRYPIFLNSEGSSNTEVDLDEFYILGASSGGVITKYHFKLKPTLSAAPGTSLSHLVAMQLMSNGQEDMVYPVPATFTIDVKINISSRSDLIISLYDAGGSKVKVLLEEVVEPQVAIKTFDISYLQAGVYLLELVQNNKPQYQRIIKL